MQKITSIIDELKWRGYSQEITILKPSQNLLDISELINETQTDYIKPRKMRLRTVLNKSRQFLGEKFTLQPIPFYKYKNIGPLKIEQEGHMHPFKLPVTKKRGTDSFYGCLREVISIEDGETVSEFYRFIELSKHLTELSQLSYTHEITHTQLNHVRGLIQDYYNIETLSIFLETVQASEDSERLLDIHDQERLTELSSSIVELNRHQNSTDQEVINVLIEGSSYTESTLKAYNMFLRYYYGTINEKRYLLKGIQRVFNQELSLEELLQELDITLANSQDINTLKKYLNRAR